MNTERSGNDSKLEQLVSYSIVNSDTLYRNLFYFTAICIVLISLAPFYYLFVIALTPSSRTTDAGIVPAGFDPSSFIEMFQVVPLHRFVFNSLVIAVMVTVIVLVFASLAGYVFGRMDFRGKPILFIGILVLSYFPGATFIVGLFRLLTGNISVLGISSPDLFGTPGVVALPLTTLTLPIAILLLTTFYSQIPDGLEDAARVTGSTRIGSLYRIIAPLSAPGLVTAGILTFITAYNEFFFSQLLTTGAAADWSPIVWGLSNYQTQVSVRYDLMAAASLFAILPIALLVLVAQKKIVSGLSGGTLRG